MALIPSLLKNAPGAKSGFGSQTTNAPNASTVSGPTYIAPPNASVMGAQAKSPTDNIKLPTNTISPGQQKTVVSSPAPQSTSGGTTGVDKNYFLQPGESSDAYNARVAQYNSSKNSGTNTSPPPVQSQAPTPGTNGAPYTPNNGLFGQLITGLANATQNNEDVKTARANLQGLQENYAKQTANLEGSPIDLSLANGQEGILNRLFAAKQGAAQTALSSALTSQGLQQNALQGAAGLAAPQLGQYGQAQYTPLGGTVGGGSGAAVSPSDPFYTTLQTYAQALANNQGSAIPSSITGNPALQAQLLQMAKQINPNFNYNQSQGAGAAQQQNAQVGGTAGVQANNTVFQQAYGAYTQLQNSVQNIDQFGGLLTQTMNAGGINPSDAKFANQTLAAIRGQLSSSQQAVYDNTLASLRSRVSGLLAAGGSEVPTAVTADAQKILDGSLPLSALNAVLGRIQQEGQILLQNQASIVNNAYKGTQTGTPGTQGGSNSSSNSSGTKYDF